jgi:hypothetical protein
MLYCSKIMHNYVPRVLFLCDNPTIKVSFFEKHVKKQKNYKLLLKLTVLELAWFPMGSQSHR